MNCKDVQKLLPLHVGGDLAATKAQSLTVHLEDCDVCAASAIQYRASYHLTKDFEPPAFSAEFYDGIRQSVLSEIARDSVKPRSWFLADFLPRSFRLRPEWAVAAVLIIAAVAFYFISSRDNARFETVQAPAWNNRKPSLPKPSEFAGSAVTPVPLDQKQHRVVNNGTTMRKPHQRSPVRSAKLPTYTVQPVNDPKESVAASQSASPRLEPLRVELQTNDSNIRIIWFTYQNAKQDPPGKGF